MMASTGCASSRFAVRSATRGLQTRAHGATATGNAFISIQNRHSRTPSSCRCSTRETARPSCRHPAKHRRSEEHTSELQSRGHLVCRLLLEKKKQKKTSFAQRKKEYKKLIVAASQGDT